MLKKISRNKFAGENHDTRTLDNAEGLLATLAPNDPDLFPLLICGADH
jgi:hypothetical protein